MTIEELDRLQNAVSILEELLPKLKKELGTTMGKKNQQGYVYDMDLRNLMIQNKGRSRLYICICRNFYEGFYKDKKNHAKHIRKTMTVGEFVAAYSKQDVLKRAVGMGEKAVSELCAILGKYGVRWE